MVSAHDSNLRKGVAPSPHLAIYVDVLLASFRQPNVRRSFLTEA
jgi:hypothetical protein